jgi:hypothetical protein
VKEIYHTFYQVTKPYTYGHDMDQEISSRYLSSIDIYQNLKINISRNSKENIYEI